MTVPHEPIAIIGRGCLVPGANSPRQLWDLVQAGRCLIGPPPFGHWGLAPERVLEGSSAPFPERTHSDRGGYVSGFDAIFDPEGFEIPVADVAAANLSVRWLLHCARQSMQEAGIQKLPTSTGVIVGNLAYPSPELCRYAESVWLGEDQSGAAHHRFTAGTLAHQTARALGLQGTALALDAACASSLYALHFASRQLQLGTAPMMLVGGINRADDLFLHMGFSALQALSPSGQSRPFHRDADGLIPAEGAAAVLLQRLDDALRGGRRILGVIEGIGLSNDGRSQGLLTPDTEGQVLAIRRCYAGDGLDPAKVSLIECHATGTRLGDGIELRGMARLFGGRDRPLVITSLKANLGHLITASGLASLIKVLAAMQQGLYPPTPNAFPLADAVEANGFRVLARPQPWASPDGPRTAVINNFGFGGNNAHLLVSEWPEAAGGAGAAPVIAVAAPRTDGSEEPIVIVGVGASLGEQDDTAAIARSLFDDRPTPPSTHATKHIDLPLAGLGFPPADLALALPQQLMILRVIRQLAPLAASAPPERIGLFVHMECDTEIARYGLRWRHAERFGDAADSSAELDRLAPKLTAAGVLGTMPNIIANRLNSLLDWQGMGLTLADHAQRGLTALTLARQALQTGDLDVAVVSAVEMGLNPVHRRALSDLQQADAQPHDAAAALVLKRADDARRDGDDILAQLQTDDDPRLLPWPSQAVAGRFGATATTSGLLDTALCALALAGSAKPGAQGKAAIPNPVSDGFIGWRIGFGQTGTIALKPEPRSTAMACGPEPLLIHCWAGADRAEVLHRLGQGRRGTDGPCRLVILAQDAAVLAARRETAADLLQRLPETPGPVNPAAGIHFSDAPVGGDCAFVFTGAAAAYGGMGRELLLALPSLWQTIEGTWPRPAPEALELIYGGGSGQDDHNGRDALMHRPDEQLIAASMLCQLHAGFSRKILGLQPQAAIGLSSGETNALVAFGVWRDAPQLVADIRTSAIYGTWLTGRCRSAAAHWGLAEHEDVDWRNWHLLAPLDQVRAAVEAEPRVEITIIQSSSECVVGGPAPDCARVIDAIGSARARPLGLNMVVHCPAFRATRERWYRIHHRAVGELPQIRFYRNDLGRAYRPDSNSAAEALTGQAEQTVDFPRTIEQAWADGVRIFVEHGPGNGLGRSIGRILKDKHHLAVSLDQRGKCAMTQAMEAAAQLIAAGQPVDIDRLNASLRAVNRWRLSADETDARAKSLSFAAHWPPVPPPNAERHETAQRQPPAPELATPVWRAPPAEDPLPPAPGHQPPAPDLSAVQRNAVLGPGEAGRQPPTVQHDGGVTSAPPQRPAPAGDAGAASTALTAPPMVSATDCPMEPPRNPDALPTVLDQIGELHRLHFRQMEQAHAQAIALQADLVTRAAAEIGLPSSTPSGRFGVAAQSAVWEVHPSPTPGPASVRFDRSDLEVLASGKVSSVFGPFFERQDGYARQVRMPGPPLLLADRVLELTGEPGSMTQGTIVTETDVRNDSWYLHHGAMPPGIMIESGQADLLLISWLGADFLNRGERVYRLLGCELRFHAGGLPKPGDTLHFDIHVTGHAKQGDVRLFFFHYDCRINGKTRLSVREGQAGFFTEAELEGSSGVLWSATDDVAAADAPMDTPPVVSTKRSFSHEDLEHFRRGDVCRCFGAGFELAGPHQRSPTIPGGRMGLLHEITELDPQGGPWGRGYLRAESPVNADDWYFAGHFKNDPCMPGTLMADAATQTMAFYLSALGFTLERDGWRFEPVIDERYRFVCRGQVIPRNRAVTYELFVESVEGGDRPKLFGAILCHCDGLKVFHCRRFGITLVPDWPLQERRAGLGLAAEHMPVGPDRKVRGDHEALMACAWGAPSEAFGEMYRIFDSPRRVPRLPGPPYHFISRIETVSSPSGEVVKGGTLRACYEVPTDAWYFDENNAPVMPFSVLMEVMLQPCGWYASYMGFAERSEVDLFFRNLDGSKTVLEQPVTRGAGTLTVDVTFLDFAKMGDMVIVFFRVTSRTDMGKASSFDTSFGFFTRESLAAQAGLPATDDERAWLERPGAHQVDLRHRPNDFFDHGARLPDSRLRMIDEITDFAPDGGRHGLGRVRTRQVVDPNAWYFKAHFYQDPVQPGSLGVEALIQALQSLVLAKGLHRDYPGCSFVTVVGDHPVVWKYRGQVRPDNREVTTLVEISHVDCRQERLLAQGDGTLWVDGMCIYRVEGLAVALQPLGESSSARVSGQAGDGVASEPTRSQMPGTQTRGVRQYDRDTAPWLWDHCPTYTLPAMPLAGLLDLMAEAAAQTAHRAITGLRDARVLRWAVPNKDGLLRLAWQVGPCEQRGCESENDLLSVTLRRENQTGDIVAQATVEFGASREPAPLLDASGPVDLVDDLYATLFHGPAFQVVQELRRGPGVAEGLLEARSTGGMAVGQLHPMLLDGAIQAIPHDALDSWFEYLPAGMAAYPTHVPWLRLFSAPPQQGTARCRVIAQQATPGNRASFLLRIDHADGAPWLAMELHESLLPRGPLGMPDQALRRRFLEQRRPVPGMRLSRWDGEVTRLHPRQVKASNWLPGTLETVYSCWSDLPRLAEQIAVTEHVAEQTGLHPSALCWNGEAVSSTHLPCNQLFPVVRRLDGALEVRDGEERLDVSNLRDWWRERLCQDDPWPGETLLFALLERFVRRVVVADPAGLAACKRRSALFLANHQVGIESILFNVLASALIELPLTVVAKAEHRDTWIGRLIGAFESWPGIDLPPSIFFFDRSDQSSLVNALPHLTTRTGRHETALLVHAAGTRSVVCPDPIRQLSAVFVDLALGADLPVIPVRFMGGLPHADSGNRKRLELPVGSHGQDIIIGSPIAADKLKGMPLGERKDFILDVLNRLGPPAAQEQPNATDRAFDAHLSELVSTYHLSELQAAIVAALESSRQSQGEQLAGALLSATPAQGGPALEALRQWFRSMSPPRTPPARSTAR